MRQIVAQGIPNRVSATIHEAPPASARAGGGLRTVLFSIGDGMFLLTVGVGAATCMRLVDSLGWSSVFAWIVGMGLAMLLQTVLAFAAAPLLGSIETMAPSMVVAMTCPMVLDFLEMIGVDLGWSWSVAYGAGFGFAMFLFVEGYGVLCRRSLRRADVRR